jgi:hypothetical protein
MNHKIESNRRASRLNLLQGLLVICALSAVAIPAPHMRATTVNSSASVSQNMALKPATLNVRKIVCHARTITIRHSPGGSKKGEMRRGDIFTVIDKHDNVWFRGYSERGQEGWVLAEYLCDLP